MISIQFHKRTEPQPAEFTQPVANQNSQAVYDGTRGRWTIVTDKGETAGAKFFVMATGCLSSANLPEFKGRDNFKGRAHHTGDWPHERIDFSGKRVAVIGTGSSAIPAIPQIVAEADHLYVFQRTANFAVPANNEPLDPDYLREMKAYYPEMRAHAKQMRNGVRFEIRDELVLAMSHEERTREFEMRWNRGGVSFLGAFNDLILNSEANDLAADFVRSKIRQTVKNPEVAKLLCPDSVIGCKRLCVDIGYFETYNRPNVELVDIRPQGIDKITPAGVRANGVEYMRWTRSFMPPGLMP